MAIKDYCFDTSKLLEEPGHEKNKTFEQIGNMYVIYELFRRLYTQGTNLGSVKGLAIGTKDSQAA